MFSRGLSSFYAVWKLPKSFEFLKLSGKLRAGPPTARGASLSVMFASTPALPLSCLCVTPASASREKKARSLLKRESWQQRLGAELRPQSMFGFLCSLFFNVCET